MFPEPASFSRQPIRIMTYNPKIAPADGRSTLDSDQRGRWGSSGQLYGGHV